MLCFQGETLQGLDYALDARGGREWCGVGEGAATGSWAVGIRSRFGSVGIEYDSHLALGRIGVPANDGEVGV